MLNPLKWLNRARHSKGFGVHSPFAFSFITETLCPPKGYAYYGEKSLNKRWRWLMRVIMRLGDNHIATLGNLPPACGEVIAMLTAQCATQVTPITTPVEFQTYIATTARPLIVIGEILPPGLITCVRSFSPAGGTMVFATPTHIDNVKNLNAMIFQAPDKMIAVSDSGLPCQTFTLNF